MLSLSHTLPLLALLGSSAFAQRPANISICDYYTTALLKNNTAANQLTLLTLVVNTAVIGNYTQPNVGIAVPGILAPGQYNGTAVNLLPYFDGGLASTNGGGNTGVVMNFLDDGGAAPLMNNLPSNGNTASNQYMLLTHLYQYFGVLLGCSMQGQSSAYPAYAGDASMYDTHKFMDLDQYQLGYFITQVGLSAASFGVATADVTAVGMALAKLFAYRCSPPTTIVPAQGAQLQSICVAATCPLDPMSTCSAYGPESQPLVANATLAGGQGASGQGSNGTMMGNGTTSSNSTMSTGTPVGPTSSVQPANANGAMKLMGSVAAAGFALVAFML